MKAVGLMLMSSLYLRLLCLIKLSNLNWVKWCNHWAYENEWILPTAKVQMNIFTPVPVDLFSFILLLKYRQSHHIWTVWKISLKDSFLVLSCLALISSVTGHALFCSLNMTTWVKKNIPSMSKQCSASVFINQFFFLAKK